MKQQTKQIDEDMSEIIEKVTDEPIQIWEECIEYFMGQGCAFKFNYLEAQENFAENLVQEINDKEDKN